MPLHVDHEPIDPASRSRFTMGVDLFDHAVDEWFDRLRGQRLPDEVFEAASRLGDFSLVWHLLNATLGLFGERGPDRALRNTVVIGFESALVNQGVKRLFNRARPIADPEVVERIRTPTTSSFPSGHASAAFTAAGILTEEQPALRPLVYGIAIVVATSRIHTRMHHPSDVVAGALVGATIARAARRWWPSP